MRAGRPVDADRACAGLYRAQLLSKSTGLYADSLTKCRPEIIDPQLGKADGEPMFITHPAFEPDPQWLDSATPGVNYKVTVLFDINSYWGRRSLTFELTIGRPQGR